ncbi:hypothetical protein GGR50DRAFT_60797 [Xylaria sp. CBS 124048]|nr:hypothetical protein GGR50DRAFT_60797 [Xylaria sp. CBS 124048]
MPAFVDWDSLLFGTPRETRPRKKVAPYPQPDASQPETPQLPDVQDVQVESLAPEGAVPEVADAEITLPENEIHEVASIAPEPTCTTTPEFRLIDQAIPWDVVPENTNDRLVVGAIFLGTVLLWFWFGRKRKSHATSRHSVANYQDSSLDDIRKDFAHQTEAIGKQFNQALKEQIDVVREQFQKVLDSQTELIEDNVRKTFNKRVETLETRIKLDQEALDNIHRVLSERMETFEGYVKTIDSKHLDQEASNIAQRSLGQRLDLVEDNFRQMDAKARAYSQRIEAIDDSVRVIDSRAKALSQRVEAAEDNMNTTDGQVTLLSHDVNRGSSVIEKLQRQVKLLPDAEKLKSLSHTWEVKVKKLETELEETRKTLDEHLAEPPPTLTWSHIESVEIEPTGLLYNKPHHPHSYDDLVVSPSSSSARSHSTAGSYPRSFSTSSTSPATHSPITPSQRRLETAGFRETTFSSRQKLFAFRGDSWPS